MIVEQISYELKFPNQMGSTLSTQELIGLQSNVLKLRQAYQFESYQWWGRIEGINQNYYVIAGVNFKGISGFPEKQYFWSSQDFKFSQLPLPREEFIPTVKKMTAFFTGQHEKILSKQAPTTKKVVSIDGEQYAVKSKNFTELDRLSIVVSLIEQDCSVVPIGAYKMLPTHQTFTNPDFRGLRISELQSLSNYGHLRYPQQKEKQIIIECDKALERNDFLDTLDQDELKQSWSLQVDESKTQATVRSLLWPGYLGYHRANSRVFGGVYLGTGIRCEDLAFLV